MHLETHEHGAKGVNETPADALFASELVNELPKVAQNVPGGVLDRAQLAYDALLAGVFGLVVLNLDDHRCQGLGDLVVEISSQGAADLGLDLIDDVELLRGLHRPAGSRRRPLPNPVGFTPRPGVTQSATHVVHVCVTEARQAQLGSQRDIYLLDYLFFAEIAGPPFVRVPIGFQRMTFPRGFLWGAGTAAHQVEGGNSLNDWWAWEHDPDSHCVEVSGDACDHWNRYPADLDLLAELGLRAYRFSVEWSRVEPREGAFSIAALDHYRQVCEAARQRGLEPIVTFHHFTTPAWLAAAGGWCEPSTAVRFGHFCEVVAGHLAGYFEFACTINEPNVLASFGYEVGVFPPGERDPARRDRATAILIDAHRQAVTAIRRAAPGVQTGMTVAMHEYLAVPGAEAIVAELKRTGEDVFLAATEGDDFIGVQNYTRLHVGPEGIKGVPDGHRTNQVGFEFRPEALGATVRRAAELTGLPVLVTENGICTEDDAERIEYTGRALRGLESCLEDGVKVLGYLHWSLLDSFEWVLGYWPKYGIIEVDRSRQARHPRPSARWLGRIARANSLETLEAV